MSKRKTNNEFIAEAIKIHGNKYNYSKVIYINNRTSISIICPEHGEFLQSPSKHLQGQGCPVCGKTKKSNTNDFIQKAIAIHGNAYDYSKVKYINNTTNVCIICPEHGEFQQTPHNHLKGQGCPICSKNKNKPKKYTTETFIKEAIKVHGKKYNYSNSKYDGILKKIRIVCPEHGEFQQTPYMHLTGAGCPNCAHMTSGLKKRTQKDVFIERAIEIHGDKYDYSKVKYITAKNKVLIICPKHGEFKQTPDKHLRGCGCPKCVQPYSKNEMEIFEYIKKIIPNEKIIEHDRETLGGKEIDILIPSKGIGIEYNGLYWHTKEKNYHLNKLKSCNEQGISLIQIFEDEYLKNKELVLKKVSHLLGAQTNKEKIMGRKCTIKEINKDEARGFLKKYHIQSFSNGTVHIGSFYGNKLIGVMSFKKETKTSNNWELVRFATNYDYICQGVGGKLFGYFVKKYNPNMIKSFADRRWTINEKENLYTKIGFEFDRYTKPEYRYYRPSDGTIRQHKFRFRKKILHKKYNLPLSMTETEMVRALGYQKIYDCGLIKYIWNKK